MERPESRERQPEHQHPTDHSSDVMLAATDQQRESQWPQQSCGRELDGDPPVGAGEKQVLHHARIPSHVVPATTPVTMPRRSPDRGSASAETELGCGKRHLFQIVAHDKRRNGVIGAEQHRAIDLGRPRVAAGGVLGTFGDGEGPIGLVDDYLVTRRIDVGMRGHVHAVDPPGSGMLQPKISELFRQRSCRGALEGPTRLEIRDQDGDLLRLLLCIQRPVQRGHRCDRRYGDSRSTESEPPPSASRNGRRLDRHADALA